MADAGRYGRIIVERFVEGKELTVGVLGDEALVVGGDSSASVGADLYV